MRMLTFRGVGVVLVKCFGGEWLGIKLVQVWRGGGYGGREAGQWEKIVQWLNEIWNHTALLEAARKANFRGLSSQIAAGFGSGSLGRNSWGWSLTAIDTAASIGIGTETVRVLALRGVHVPMGIRSEEMAIWLAGLMAEDLGMSNVIVESNCRQAILLCMKWIGRAANRVAAKLASLALGRNLPRPWRAV
ncbi:hypothetical protein RHSIM_RhsimUnG0019900 [Rhododendron simsii]|uniref:RNase H type-1 domain-containing protein n=1 Tax=Rhododendron simsii TaxID=118357 RepID=A0A834FW82_RHOSS|nr:hypothetical protein RHSIM_RhsimUnG0019900 [Rhododendron simsii]